MSLATSDYLNAAPRSLAQVELESMIKKLGRDRRRMLDLLHKLQDEMGIDTVNGGAWVSRENCERLEQIIYEVEQPA